MKPVFRRSCSMYLNRHLQENKTNICFFISSRTICNGIGFARLELQKQHLSTNLNLSVVYLRLTLPIVAHDIREYSSLSHSYFFLQYSRNLDSLLALKMCCLYLDVVHLIPYLISTLLPSNGRASVGGTSG